MNELARRDAVKLAAVGAVAAVLASVTSAADDKPAKSPRDDKEVKATEATVKAGVANKNTGPVVVPKILEVKYAIQTSNPPNLVVEVKGEVPTLGYKDEKLSRVIYAQAPKDGIQDYIMMATPPADLAGQRVTTIEAKDTWKEYTKEAPWLKGIRIHGVGEGVIEVKFGGGK